MSGDASGHRQRAVMASDAEWELVGRAAKRRGMDRSRYLIHRALMPDALSTEVLRRAVRELLVRELLGELLVLSLVEERRLREAGAGQAWEDTCDAVDAWIASEGELERLTDPGAANRWKALGGELEGKDEG